jgi:hypothetical protein
LIRDLKNLDVYRILFTRELYYQENKYQVPYVVVGRGGHWELHHIQKHSNGDQNDTPFKLPDMENVVSEKYKNASIRSITAPKGYTYSDVGKKVYTGYEDYNIIPAGSADGSRISSAEEMFNDLDRVKDRHYASTVPELSRIYLKK